jgi:hypothetical protein
MSGGGSGREALIAAMRGPEYREPPRIDDPVALAFARRLQARGIVAVPGVEDERERTRKVLQYLKDSRILEQLEAERKAAAEPPPPPPPTTATLVRKVLEQEAEAINKEEARKAAQANNVIPQPSSSDPAASVPLNGVAVLRRALAGGGGTINGQ